MKPQNLRIIFPTCYLGNAGGNKRRSAPSAISELGLAAFLYLHGAREDNLCGTSHLVTLIYVGNLSIVGAMTVSGEGPSFTEKAQALAAPIVIYLPLTEGAVLSTPRCHHLREALAEAVAAGC